MQWFGEGALTQLFCFSADFYDVLKCLVLSRCPFFVKLYFFKEVKYYLERGREEDIETI